MSFPVCADGSAGCGRSAGHHAAESGEASLPLSDQRVWGQIQQAAVVLILERKWHRLPEFAEEVSHLSHVSLDVFNVRSHQPLLLREVDGRRGAVFQDGNVGALVQAEVHPRL